MPVNAFPVIERELRAEARHGATYWLRVLAAGTAITVCASILIGSRLAGGQLGNVIFSQLYLTFSYAVWILVPLLTADCKPFAFGIGLALQATLAAVLWLLLRWKALQRSFLLGF